MKLLDAEVRLSREMTLLDATLIGVGAMIGAGIFVLTGIAAGVAGPALILAFALNGVIALFTAMSYAELGSCYHDAGGGYLWVKEGLPAWNGFLSGWMSWFAHAVACSVYALGFGAYFNHVLHEFGTSLPHWSFLPPEKLLAGVIALLFGYINFRGASEAGKIGNIVTLTKIAILAVFVAFGIETVLKLPDWHAPFRPFFAHGWGGVFKAMGLTFIAFEGYEVISQCSEEVKNPKRNIPRAVFLSLLIVLPIYILVAFTALGSVHVTSGTPWDYLAKYKETALVEVSKSFFVGGGIMLLVGGLISTVSALNATVYSSSRVAFAMGRDRNLPAFFSRVHPKKFTPHWAILVSLLIIVTMAVTLPIEDVASAADIMFLLLFLQVNIAMIRLRKKRPDLDRGFVTPLFPVLSILGILLLLFLAVYMFNYSRIAWIVTIAWIACGLVFYRVYAAKREQEHVQKVRAIERLEKHDYRILVALSNPASMHSLIALATGMAKRHDAEIIVLHVVEVPDGMPLIAGLEDEARARAFLDKATEMVGDAGVPVRPIVRVAHRISLGIVETVEEEQCNFVIMGRNRHPKIAERVLASVLDSVFQKATCEVAVLHGTLPKAGVSELYVPFAQDAHARLALEIAPAIAEELGSRVRVGAVFDPRADVAKRQEQAQRIRKEIADSGLDSELEETIHEDAARGILVQARSAGLIVMGGRTGDFLELLFARSLAREITEGALCPVLWVREYEERESFWAALFKPLPGEEELSHD